MIVVFLFVCFFVCFFFFLVCFFFVFFVLFIYLLLFLFFFFFFLENYNIYLDTHLIWRYALKTDILGPVVQSVVSLTRSLRVILLTVLGDSIYIILIFFAEKM